MSSPAVVDTCLLPWLSPPGVKDFYDLCLEDFMSSPADVGTCLLPWLLCLEDFYELFSW